MKWFRLKFRSPSIESEYKRIKDASMNSFFKILILILLVFSIVALVQSIKSHQLGSLIRVLVFIVICLLLFIFGHKLGRFIDYALTLLSLALYLSGVITGGLAVSAIPDQTMKSYLVSMFIGGYLTGIFERLVILELPRLELKLLFSTASLITRLILYPPQPPQAAFTYAFLISFWLLCVFADIRKEKSDRSLFKSFYDVREETIKFKNLMISGLPTNILILSKDIQQKLFINEYFRSAFNIDRNNEAWSPHEWLISNNIEKDSVHIECLANEINQGSTLEEFLLIMNEKEHSIKDQDISFITKIHVIETDENKVFEVKVLPLIWDSKDAIVIVMNDVTQQYMNLSLKIADENKDKMIAMVSHELRNPLNGILGMVYIMEKKIKDQEVLKYLTVCKDSAKLLLNLVNSILDLGQIRNNKLQLHISKGNLAEMLREIYLLFDYQFQQKNIHLEIETDPNTPKFIVTDLNRLRQILINLIANALKFTFDGEVCIHVRPDEKIENNILFTVSDTGIGIKDEEKKKLFKMYGRLDQSDRKINIEGIGLGLTISDHLVRLLSCKNDEDGIKVESVFGKGTTLSFSIKQDLDPSSTIVEAVTTEYNIEESICEEGDHELHKKMSAHVLYSKQTLSGSSNSVKEHTITNSGQKETESDCCRLLYTDDEEIQTRSSREKTRVLLVDDNPFNIMVAKNLLEGLGYHVETALNGQLAVDAVKKAHGNANPFHVIFMDCQMPVMDGFEATTIIQKLVKDGEIDKVIIIALSANDSEDDKKRCLEVGMNDHLAKPVTEGRIKATLDKYLTKKPVQQKMKQFSRIDHQG